MITKLFDIEPQQPGYETAGAEPCLREMVFNYYRDHFDLQHSAALTKEYFDQLMFQYSQQEMNDEN